MLLKYVLAALAVLCGAAYDLKYKRIPNKITLPFMAIGLILNLWLGGLDGLMDSIFAILVSFAGILLFMFGIMGAGDIKLFMAVGSLLGLRMGIATILLSFLVGGVVGVIVLLLRKNGKRRFMFLYRYICVTLGTRQVKPYEVIDKENDAYFSFGACIAAGCLIAMILNHLGVVENYFMF